VPFLTAVASPLLSTVATEVVSELQVKLAPLITFPFASFAMALNCRVCPAAIDAGEGVTVTLATCTTVRVALPLTPLLVAVICALPCAMVVTNPLLSTVATELVFELQVKLAPLITFPLASFAMALNCSVCPLLTVTDEGERVTLATAPIGGAFEPVEPPPQPDRKREQTITNSSPVVTAWSTKSMALSALNNLQLLHSGLSLAQKTAAQPLHVTRYVTNGCIPMRGFTARQSRNLTQSYPTDVLLFQRGRPHPTAVTCSGGHREDDLCRSGAESADMTGSNPVLRRHEMAS